MHAKWGLPCGSDVELGTAEVLDVLDTSAQFKNGFIRSVKLHAELLDARIPELFRRVHRPLIKVVIVGEVSVPHHLSDVGFSSISGRDPSRSNLVIGVIVVIQLLVQLPIILGSK